MIKPRIKGLADQFRRGIVADAFGVMEETRAKLLWAFVKEKTGVVIGVSAPIFVRVVQI